jgi:hypothetical protein
MQINLSPEEWAQTPEGVQRVLLSALEYIRDSEQSLIAAKKQVRADLDRILSISLPVATYVSSSAARVPGRAVFVCDTPLSRQAKLAYGLSKAGWDVTLLHKTKPFFEPQQYFSRVLTYSNTAEAVLLAASQPGAIFHVFSSWDFSTARAFMTNRPGIVVFDNYDVFAGCLQPEMASAREAMIADERFCFEQADGICSRSLTMQNLKRVTDYSITAKNIFFPEYCWDRPPAETGTLLPKRTDGIHIVYVGACGSALFNDPQGSGCTDKNFLDLIARENIHYHMYPCVSPEGDFTALFHDYLTYAEKSPNFHFHRPLDCDRLNEELSQYHLGLLISSSEVARTGDSCYQPQAFRYHLANKAFDYLDASLPLLLHCGQTLNWMFSRTGAAHITSREQLPDVLNALTNGSLSLEALAMKVPAARERYSVWRQARRLAKFYDELGNSQSDARAGRSMVGPFSLGGGGE